MKKFENFDSSVRRIVASIWFTSILMFGLNIVTYTTGTNNINVEKNWNNDARFSVEVEEFSGVKLSGKQIALSQKAVESPNESFTDDNLTLTTIVKNNPPYSFNKSEGRRLCGRGSLFAIFPCKEHATNLTDGNKNLSLVLTSSMPSLMPSFVVENDDPDHMDTNVVSEGNGPEGLRDKTPTKDLSYDPPERDRNSSGKISFISPTAGKAKTPTKSPQSGGRKFAPQSSPVATPSMTSESGQAPSVTLFDAMVSDEALALESFHPPSLSPNGRIYQQYTPSECLEFDVIEHNFNANNQIIRFKYYAEVSTEDEDFLSSLEVSIRKTALEEFFDCEKSSENKDIRRKIGSDEDRVVSFVDSFPPDYISSAESCVPIMDIENTCIVINGLLTLGVSDEHLGSAAKRLHRAIRYDMEHDKYINENNPFLKRVALSSNGDHKEEKDISLNEGNVTKLKAIIPLVILGGCTLIIFSFVFIWQSRSSKCKKESDGGRFLKNQMVRNRSIGKLKMDNGYCETNNTNPFSSLEVIQEDYYDDHEHSLGDADLNVVCGGANYGISTLSTIHEHGSECLSESSISTKSKKSQDHLKHLSSIGNTYVHVLTKDNESLESTNSEMSFII